MRLGSLICLLAVTLALASSASAMAQSLGQLAGQQISAHTAAAPPTTPAPVTPPVADDPDEQPLLPVAAWLAIGLLSGLTLAIATRAFIDDRRSRLRLQGLESDVGILQAAIMPRLPAYLDGADVSVAYRPASGLAAGGDFYDCFQLPTGEVVVLVGDVSGHGPEALTRTVKVHYALRAFLRAGLTPRLALYHAAEVISDDLGDHFATVVIMSYDARTGLLTWASAGHPPPMFVGDRAVPCVELPASPMLGFAIPTGMRQSTISLPAQTTACCYTDGLTEARWPEGGQLQVAGLKQVLHQLPALEAVALLRHLVEHADVRDDMAVAMLTAERAPAQDAWIEEYLTAASDPQLAMLLEACALAPQLQKQISAQVAAQSEPVILRVMPLHGAYELHTVSETGAAQEVLVSTI